MNPSANKFVGSPIIELSPRSTASSIADMMSRSWNAGDYRSDLMNAREYRAPVTFATVTVPLALRKRE